MAGALTGATIGKTFNGQRLILLFAVTMLVVGAHMLRPRPGRGGGGGRAAALTAAVIAKVVGVGLCVGFLSGLFGIGGSSSFQLLFWQLAFR